ncbi:GlsB/YeaQ/YmgE family stress response membrane protein [Blastococcus sp. TML/M2B]|uniref:GlsB/YeaQ/YmgE family stress response membrane protein n=1 Tax=unclassified Blastococcus TaxID=2619396 RepID=UPI00190DB72F|nr:MULTISPECIES: GlsB/YeaQ/YmgE family stress response membrane protein [unclassified Blastococcus]MBN1094432.1 GlsB/YeaQ/YmgE family stress response membrane protein [Blastococcus sp. TML/M2B]MBN1095392.1 GlsB/YeaQ/YmgE family stress response membrane protein [Blastococcus sp. TML/C7B]
MIGFLVAGLIIGALARLIVPGKQHLGILATLALGLVGSLIGGLIAQAFNKGDIWELNVTGFVLAVIAAVLLIGVAERISAGSKRGAVR